MNCVPLTSESPSLLCETDRLEPDRAQSRGAVEELAVHDGLPFADERQREMRERREVAARPDRAARGNPRQHAAVQALEQQLDGHDARAGEPLRERVRAQQHRRAHDVVGVRLADTARMAAQEAQLQLLRELLRDVSRARSGRSPYSRRTCARRECPRRARAPPAWRSRAESASSADAPPTATSHTSARVRSSPVRTIAPVTSRV